MVSRSRVSRRSVLKASSVGALGALAGCTGGNGGGNGDDGTNGGGGGGATTLSVATFFTEEQQMYTAQIEPFMEYVEDHDDVDISFNVHPGGELGGPLEAIDLVQGGVADIATIVPAYLSESFPLTVGVELPGLDYTVEDMTKAFWELSHGYLYENEYQDLGIVPVITPVFVPAQISTVDTPFAERDSLEGLTIRTAGGIQNFTLEALGATPTQIEGPDLYTSLERGTIDGIFTHLSGAADWSLQELLGYSTSNGRFGSNTILWGMSDATFESLSETEQEVLLEASEHANSYWAEDIVRDTEETEQMFEEAGVDVYDVDEDLLDDLYENEFVDVQNRWADGVGEAGQEFLDEYQTALEDAS